MSNYYFNLVLQLTHADRSVKRMNNYYFNLVLKKQEIFEAFLHSESFSEQVYSILLCNTVYDCLAQYTVV